MQLQSQFLFVLLTFAAHVSSSYTRPEVYFSASKGYPDLSGQQEFPYSVYTEERAASDTKMIAVRIGLIVATMPAHVTIDHWTQVFEQIKAVWERHQDTDLDAIKIPQLPGLPMQLHDSTPLMAAIRVFRDSSVKLSFEENIKFDPEALGLFRSNPELLTRFHVKNFGRWISENTYISRDITKPKMVVLFRDAIGKIPYIEIYRPELMSLLKRGEYDFIRLGSAVESIDDATVEGSSAESIGSILITSEQAGVLAGILDVDADELTFQGIGEVLGRLEDGISDRKLASIAVVLGKPTEELRTLVPQTGAAAARTGVVHAIVAPPAPARAGGLERLAEMMETTVRDLQATYTAEDLEAFLAGFN